MQTTRHRVPNHLGEEVVASLGALLLLVSIMPKFTANVRVTAATGLGMALLGSPRRVPVGFTGSLN